METLMYYVIQPTRFNRKKIAIGESLTLTESQARPLRNGGFITADKTAAERIAELVQENEVLRVSAKEKEIPAIDGDVSGEKDASAKPSEKSETTEPAK